MLLAVRDLRVGYNKAALGVSSVTLDAPEGEITLVLGANGAGKTTTLRAISGFLPSDRASVIAGDILYEDSSILRMSPQRRVAHGIAIVPESEKIFSTLTVDENLRVGFRGRKADARVQLDFVYDLFPNLANRRDLTAGLLSGGERQMLSIGSALMLKPRLLLADEISLGVAPILVTTLFKKMREINREQGATVLLVEQNAEALRYADTTYLMETGMMKSRHERDDSLSRDAMVRAYFGGNGLPSEDSQTHDKSQS